MPVGPSTGNKKKPVIEYNGRRYLIDGHLFKIGKGHRVDIRIDGLFSAAIHLQISGDPQSGYWAEHLAGWPKTRLNGRRLNMSALGHGDVISIGKRRFLFLAPGSNVIDSHAEQEPVKTVRGPGVYHQTRVRPPAESRRPVAKSPVRGAGRGVAPPIERMKPVQVPRPVSAPPRVLRPTPQDPLSHGAVQGQETRIEEFDLTRIREYDGSLRKVPTGIAVPGYDEILALVSVDVKAGTADLPAFPWLATRLLELVKNPDVNINDLVRLINQDVSLSAHVLKVANSVYYARLCEVEGVRDAVVRLGMKEVASIAAAASIRTLFDKKDNMTRGQFAPFWKRVWHHSITTALGAGWLSLEIGKGDSERTFLEGMLHDIGKIAVLRSLSSLTESGKLSKVPIDDYAVATVMDSLHVEAGIALAVAWKLPEHVLDVCKGHHLEEEVEEVEEVPGIVSNRVDENFGNLGEKEELEDRDTRVHSQGNIHLVRLMSGLDDIRVNPFYRKNLEEEVFESSKALEMNLFQFRALISQAVDFSHKASSIASGDG